MLVNLAAIPAPIAAGLTIFTRVWWMAAEALWVGLALFLRNGRKVKAAALDTAEVEDTVDTNLE